MVQWHQVKDAIRAYKNLTSAEGSDPLEELNIRHKLRYSYVRYPCDPAFETGWNWLKLVETGIMDLELRMSEEYLMYRTEQLLTSRT